MFTISRPTVLASGLPGLKKLLKYHTWMVRLVDQSGAPCALHLAVRDATGEPVIELSDP